MSRTSSLSRALALVALVATPGCKDEYEPPGTACGRICRSLESCGVSPSVFEAERDDLRVCVERCEVNANAVDECAPAKETNVRWCSAEGPEGAEGPQRCGEILECLASAFDIDVPLVEASAIVRVGAPDPGASRGAAPPSVNGVCSETDEQLIPAQTPRGLCPDEAYLDALGTTEATARVLTADVESDASPLSRGTLTARDTVVVPVGLVQPEARLEGIVPEFSDPEPSDTDDDGASESGAESCAPSGALPGGLAGRYCWIFRAPPSVLRVASEPHELWVSVPPTVAETLDLARRQADLDAKVLRATAAPLLHTCESDAIHCLDGLDNDGDALTDCNDPECEAWCDEAESALADCRDGEDNDGDGRSDCEDPGCAPHCEQSQIECRDDADNDLNMLTNCEDPGCAWLCELAECDEAVCGGNVCKAVDGEPACERPRSGGCQWVCGTEGECTDGMDNDADGLTDSADPDCAN